MTHFVSVENWVKGQTTVRVHLFICVMRFKTRLNNLFYNSFIIWPSLLETMIDYWLFMLFFSRSLTSQHTVFKTNIHFRNAMKVFSPCELKSSQFWKVLLFSKSQPPPSCSRPGDLWPGSYQHGGGGVGVHFSLKSLENATCY